MNEGREWCTVVVVVVVALRRGDDRARGSEGVDSRRRAEEGPCHAFTWPGDLQLIVYISRHIESTVQSPQMHIPGPAVGE